VTTQAGIELAQSLGIPFFEQSNKTAVNCEELYQKIACELVLENRGKLAAQNKKNCIIM
jgi:hypothetical protein